MEFITLELRPRLQSCNAFIAVRKDLCLKNVRIRLMESNIILVLEDRRINLSLPSVKVIPISLSMLSVIDNWICFRLQTAPLESVFGSFGTEIVTDTNNTSVQSSNSPQPFLDNIKLLFKTSECIILCTCCKNVLSKSINFKRFLSLPDLEYDADEWFCCKHSSNVVANIQLQESDYLYGSCFSVLHKNIFESNVHIDNKALICNKCLLHIGTPHAYSLFKIWNCCVDYKPQSNALNTMDATDPLSDFLILVKESLSEILGEEIILQSSVGKQIHCLLIRPMDCKLNLITEPNHKVMNDIGTISLQQKCVAKVLYKYGTSKITNTNYSNIKHLEVGLPIIEAGLNYLLSSTKRLPHVHRTTVATDYFLGYIVLQEIVN